MMEMEYKKLFGWKYTLDKELTAFTMVCTGSRLAHGKKTALLPGTSGERPTPADVINRDVEADRDISIPYITLLSNGFIRLAKGYSWDGASGPAVDTPCIMAASAVHDALYQLMRVGKLPLMYRRDADKTLHKMCISAGMPRWRAEYVYWAVRLFGGRLAKHPYDCDKNVVQTAPVNGDETKKPCLGLNECSRIQEN
jgi:hypothetical protein